MRLKLTNLTQFISDMTAEEVDMAIAEAHKWQTFYADRTVVPNKYTQYYKALYLKVNLDVDLTPMIEHVNQVGIDAVYCNIIMFELTARKQYEYYSHISEQLNAVLTKQLEGISA